MAAEAVGDWRRREIDSLRVDHCGGYEVSLFVEPTQPSLLCSLYVCPSHEHIYICLLHTLCVYPILFGTCSWSGSGSVRVRVRVRLRKQYPLELMQLICKYSKYIVIDYGPHWVSTKEAKTRALTDEFGAIAYMECSALTGFNVEQLFEAAVTAVLHPERLENGAKWKSKNKCQHLCCITL